MKAGRLTYVLQIQRSITDVDDYGSPVTAWFDYVTLRADRVANDNAATIRGERESDEQTLTFRTRWHYIGALEGKRFLFDGEPFELVSVSEIGRRRGLEIKLIRRGSQ